MEHLFNIIAILLFSCIVQFFYFTTTLKRLVPEESIDEEELQEEIPEEIPEEELSPEKFQNFDYYIEKFSQIK